jgi:hypothetical protein
MIAARDGVLERLLESSPVAGAWMTVGDLVWEGGVEFAGRAHEFPSARVLRNVSAPNDCPAIL